MAPLDPNAIHESNTRPLVTFGAQILLVAGLSTHIIQNIRRAARSLPPSTETRTQEPLRQRHAAIFAALALLGLASVTTFSVAWRVLSYFEWAEKGNHETPGSLWTGWYGTGDDGVGRWHLGDWFRDVSLAQESDAVAVGSHEGFLYTSQHFVGLTAASMFFGIEGRRRNLSTATIASFVLLAATGSLSYAVNLFFVTLLFTPVALHNDDSPRHDALFAPKPAVYYVPVFVSFLFLHYLPSFLAKGEDVRLLRAGYVAVPFFLAFAPQIIPTRFGRQHVSKAAAHRSLTSAFYVLGLTSLFLHWKLIGTSLFSNTPPEQNSVYDLLKNAVGKQDKSNRFFTGLGNTAQRLKLVSRHPAISVTASDVVVTAVALLAWTLVRNLDVTDILETSLLSFLAPARTEKHVAFKDKVEDVAEDLEEELHPVTPKRRGRPKKNAVNGITSDASTTGTLRRSTRRKAKSDYESDAEDTYQPSAQAREEVKQTETDGASIAEDLVAGGESTALALFLAFAGGLGQLIAGVLGAEATGSTPAGE